MCVCTRSAFCMTHPLHALLHLLSQSKTGSSCSALLLSLYFPCESAPVCLLLFPVTHASIAGGVGMSTATAAGAAAGTGVAALFLLWLRL